MNQQPAIDPGPQHNGIPFPPVQPDPLPASSPRGQRRHAPRRPLLPWEDPGILEDKRQQAQLLGPLSPEEL